MSVLTKGLSNMISRCNTCNGTKQILTLGNLKKPCHTCNGIGSIKPEVTTVNGKELENVIPVKKKPGRKPFLPREVLQVATL